MKLIISPLLLTILKVSADREYLGLLPFDKCGSITEPQKGFWVGRGDDASRKLRFHPECEREGNTNGKCTIMCKDYSTNLILDRTKEGKWDKAVNADYAKKYLVKCKCETWMEDDGTVTTEDCGWKPRRYWKEKSYREGYDLGDAGVGEEPWIKPTKYPLDANINGRKRRGVEDREPRMKFYCEDEAPAHIKEDWMLKPEDVGVREFKDNKGYETCGNMYNIFELTGGEWHCKMNVTNEATGATHTEEVDPTNVPHTALCSWGCNVGSNWEAKEARFACAKPWIARPDNDWALKDIWRRFRGYGLRVYKQGMLDCQHFDSNILRKK